jgi:hypothetical protein
MTWLLDIVTISKNMNSSWYSKIMTFCWSSLQSHQEYYEFILVLTSKMTQLYFMLGIVTISSRIIWIHLGLNIKNNKTLSRNNLIKNKIPISWASLQSHPQSHQEWGDYILGIVTISRMTPAPVYDFKTLQAHVRNPWW